MGRFATAHAFLNPLVPGLRPISPIAWIPLAIPVDRVSATSRRSSSVFHVVRFFPIEWWANRGAA
jgi:ABC-type nitrate/sulfonate/bicarbonate transport system permease component